MSIYPSNLIIYRISNSVNTKVYIGKTVDHEKRWARHISDTIAGCDYCIHNAMRKHGIENFKSEPIFNVFKEEDLNWAEIELIKQWDCCTKDGDYKGYNIERGGQGFSTDGSKQLQASRLAEGTHHNTIMHTCSYCGRSGKGTGFTSQHFENCALSPSYVPRIYGDKEKLWLMSTPEGLLTLTNNMSEYCRMYDLDTSSMAKVAKGRENRSQHRGHSCKELSVSVTKWVMTNMLKTVYFCDVF